MATDQSGTGDRRERSRADESDVREAVSRVETPPSRGEGGLLGELRGGDEPDWRRVTVQSTAAAWVLAAGAAGYMEGAFTTPYPEIAGVATLFGAGIGAGFAGLMVLLVWRDSDGE